MGKRRTLRKHERDALLLRIARQCGTFTVRQAHRICSCIVDWQERTLQHYLHELVQEGRLFGPVGYFYCADEQTYVRLREVYERDVPQRVGDVRSWLARVAWVREERFPDGMRIRARLVLDGAPFFVDMLLYPGSRAHLSLLLAAGVSHPSLLPGSLVLVDVMRTGLYCDVVRLLDQDGNELWHRASAEELAEFRKWADDYISSCVQSPSDSGRRSVHA